MKSSAQQSAANKHPNQTDKAVKMLANTIYRQLQDEGCAARDIISVSSQLIGLVTHELSKIDQPG